jgi:hypothetical protein
LVQPLSQKSVSCSDKVNVLLFRKTIKTEKMKTYSISQRIASLTIFLIIISAIETHSQQVIIFNDGTESKAFITYQSRDTVKYYLVSKPEILYVETMDHIRRIIPMNPSMDIPDSLSYSQCKKKYVHYRKMIIGGSILFSFGGVLTGLGIAGLVSLSDEHHELTDFAKVICATATSIGVVGVITGIAMTVKGALNMQKYKEKLHGFSFDLKYTPQVKGISVAYRF